MSESNRRTFLKLSGGVLGGLFAGSTVTAAERTDRFIVTGKSVPSDLEVVHEMPGVDVTVVRGTEKDVKQSSSVKKYAPDLELTLDSPVSQPEAAPEADSTEDPLEAFQWDKDVQDIDTVHERTRGEGTRVSIIDTGIDEGHPDFQDNLNVDLSRNFTSDGGDHNPQGVEYHGTHVGGIVAADDNGTGVVGSAPGTELVDCRVFSDGGGASFANILAAVSYSAAVGADVANLSLGAYPIPRQSFGSFYGKVLNSIMTYANSQGTLLVIAAGNDAADLQHDKNFVSIPNEGAQALSVSSTSSVGFNPLTGEADNPGYQPSSFTNYGTNAITIGAPGGDVPAGGGTADLVYNAIPEKAADAFGLPAPYAYLAGTSMAAPQVAGAAALVKSENPDYNPNQIEAALKKAASVPAEFGKEYFGAGFIDVLGALDE
jgi:subtilisin family serine protease